MILAEDRELFRISIEAGRNAYAPYSKFNVGAALKCADGEVFTGVNIENSAYGAGICAERTAMSKAVSEGHRSFKKIAVSGNGGEAWPCGICRQFMFEFSPEMEVITGTDEDHLEKLTLKELLLKGFSLNTEE